MVAPATGGVNAIRIQDNGTLFCALPIFPSPLVAMERATFSEAIRCLDRVMLPRISGVPVEVICGAVAIQNTSPHVPACA